MNSQEPQHAFAALAPVSGEFTDCYSLSDALGAF